MNEYEPVNILITGVESTEQLPLINVLASLNTNLVVAASGEKTLCHIATADFAIIIIRLETFAADPISFLQHVRSNTRSATVPVIFIESEENTSFPLEQAYLLGPVDYVMESIAPFIFKAKVDFFIDLYCKTKLLSASTQWNIDSLEQAHISEKIRVGEYRYRMLFDSIDEGFCIIEVLFDKDGKPDDYRFIEANAIFTRQTGLENVIGRRVKEFLPYHDSHWFETYGRVALTGEPVRLIDEAKSMGRWFDLYAFRIEENNKPLVAVLFKDISLQKRAEVDRERLLKELQIANAQMNNVFQKAPAFMCMLNGPQHVIEIVNEKYFQLIGWRDVIGKPVGLALPEIVGQGYIRILDDVYRTGVHFVGKDAGVMLQRQANGSMEERTLDFVYIPLKDADEKVYGILVHGIDITEQKRAEDGLRNLAVELTRSNQRKTEFLATLAHELRNPLAPIRNGLEVLRLTNNDPDVSQKIRDMLQRQVDQMVHLIDDLLDIARISSGKLELKKEREILSKIVGNAIETSMPIINDYQHELSIEIPDEPIYLNADATRLSQVIGNLLTNAAKYTPREGKISLSINVVGADVVIAVADNGIGIPAESLPTIFDMFMQVEQNKNCAQGGLGIGLALVHQIVEMHGGKVSVHSEGAGKGSTFTLSLPVVTEKEIDKGNTDIYIDLHNSQKNKILRILIADDNIDAAESLANLLQIFGHETRVTHDGIDALQAAQKFLPDIAFLDIGMPGMSGHEVAAAVKKLPEVRHMVLVALTGWGTEKDRAKSKIAGFDHHLTKPMNIDTVEKLLSGFT